MIDAQVEKTTTPVRLPRSLGRSLSYLSVPLLVFLTTRIVLACLARWSTSLLPVLHLNKIVLPAADPLARAWQWTSPWFRFDARWYVDVAQHGYHYGTPENSNTNFFPLYPLLIRAVQPLTAGSAWAAGLLVANACFLASLVLLWKWAKLRWPEEVAFRALMLVAVFPFAFFFATPYAEPLFLMLAVAAFLFAEEDRWGWAVAAAALCVLSRPVGAAVVAGLVVMALQQRSPRRAAASAAALTPLALFAAYLWFQVGHPLAFTVAHSQGWVPPHGGLLHTIQSQFATSLSPWDRVDAAVTVLFAGSTVLVWKRLGPGYAAFVAVGLALPLIHGLVCMERYVIVLFPVMASWATVRQGFLQRTIFAVSALGLVLATTMFAAGYSIF